MKKIMILSVMLLTASLVADVETDTIPTSRGDLSISFIGHGTLYVQWDGKVVHVDPWSRLADYSTLPKADLILITHQHGDHLDPNAIEAVSTETTAIILTEKCAEQVDGVVMKNGDTTEMKGISIKAVPAYNIKNTRDNGQPFHPRGEGNGYVVTFADVTVYVAGDTEHIPEMAELNGHIDVAFLPMNLPYTMSPEMAAVAAKSIAPKILYPYHYGDSNVEKLLDLLKDSDIDIRIRKMQ